ncbi:MAG: ChaB family protein [Patescibacteria group bacterium]|jgi:cation transport regulator
MPYQSNDELPGRVKDNIPKHAQDIYREAYNSAWEQYEDSEDRRGNRSREETAHAVAWSAVQSKYHKNDKGNWVKNDE